MGGRCSKGIVTGNLAAHCTYGVKMYCTTESHPVNAAHLTDENCVAGGHLLFSLSPASPLLYTNTVHCGVKQSQSVLIAVIRHTYGLICDKLHSSLISGSC